jgi:hypothetical protein
MIRSYEVHRAESAMVLLIDSRGIHDLTLVTYYIIPWADLRGATEADGDVFLYFHDGAKMNELYIPSSAFADTEAAALFAGTLRSLHRAKGDLSTIPSEARAAFPPPE